MPDEKTGRADQFPRSLCVFEKYQQLIHRHAPAFIRHVLERFRLRSLNAAQVTSQLGISRSRLYALATAYNTARARQPKHAWQPGVSGGAHATAWPQPVVDLLHKRLPIGTQRLRIEKPPCTKVVLCLHPDGHHSVLAAPPVPQQKPVLLFTNRPN